MLAWTHRALARTRLHFKHVRLMEWFIPDGGAAKMEMREKRFQELCEALRSELRRHWTYSPELAEEIAVRLAALQVSREVQTRML
jgi:hypothetical protein